MAGSPESDMAFEVGKHVSVELKDGATLRGFVHAQDSGAGLVCLELAPSAEVALISTANVKAVSAVADLPEKRKWPVNRAYDLYSCNHADAGLTMRAVAGATIVWFTWRTSQP